MDKQGIIDASKKRREGERIFYTLMSGKWLLGFGLRSEMSHERWQDLRNRTR